MNEPFFCSICTREHLALKETDILVDMLRAPVNPADVNKIQGM